MFKFLHAADIHLDSPLKQLANYEGAPVEACRLATRHALENLVQLAIDEKVNFVVIVGDLTDGDWRDYQSALFFSNQMRLLRDANIKVFLIRGNHDAANQMNLTLSLPDNAVFLSHKKPETIVIDDLGVAIHGQGYALKNVTDNLTVNYPKPTSGLFNLGLLHTCAEVKDGSHERYAPCTVDDLKRIGYQYWALGHIHKREVLHPGEPFIAFSGNIQGRHARETGEKGCLLVTLDDAQGVTVEPRWLHVMRWEVHSVDATGARDVDEVLERFQKSLGASLQEMADANFALRIELTGPCPAHNLIAARKSKFDNELRQVANDVGDGRLWVEKVIINTKAQLNRADLDAEGPLAELDQLIEEYHADPRRLEGLRQKELDDLLKKIDPEIADDLDLEKILEQVGPLLLDRFHLL